MRDFVYLAPETLEEAAALKLEHDDKAIFMAGATDVIIRLRDHLIAPDFVIDLKNIPDLGSITFSETDGLHIGALATMTQIATNEHVLRHYPYLAEAASYVGGRQIRNRATCVGNIVNASSQTGIVTIAQIEPIAVIFTAPEPNSGSGYSSAMIGIRRRCSFGPTGISHSLPTMGV